MPVKLRLAVLGDSIAGGHGASRPEDKLSRRLAQGLRDAGDDARAQVFALAGSQSSALAAQVDKALEWDPQLAVVVIGANDVVHRVPPEEARLLADAITQVKQEIHSCAVCYNFTDQEICEICSSERPLL